MRTDLLSVVDIFCGAGGLSEGFRTARFADDTAFEVVFGLDKDAACMATYRANVLERFALEERVTRGPCRDVQGPNADDVLRAAGVTQVDVVIGGPNCQAVSTAGVRNASDERNGMFDAFLSLVGALRPRWVVMENVPGLAHRTSLPILNDVLAGLGALPGYEVAAEVLLAAAYGVPQFRYRLFVIATRSGRPIRFPAPTHGPNDLAPYRTVADALGGETGDDWQPGVADRLDDANAQRVSWVPPGGDWRDIPVGLLPDRCFSVRTSDQKGAYGRLRWDRPAFTITGLASNVTAGPFTHPSENRAVSPREAASLQGFPEEFVFSGPAASAYRQIGNAVPPPLSRAVAECIAANDAGQQVGIEGRLTPALVADAVQGRRKLPVLTPRLEPPREPPPRLAGASVSVVQSRDNQEATERLEVEAKLPANLWTAKRARAILGYKAGRPVGELAGELKLSERTVQNWIAGYEADGIEGWRAYHTPTLRLARGDARLARRLDVAIRLVRQVESGPSPKRPSITPRLQELIRKFGGLSANELRRRVALQGLHPGTLYVGDLLAVADELHEDGVAVDDIAASA